jgi:hypothetical protein
MKTAAYWIEKLELEKHPEGGYFREIYLSDDVVPQTGLPANFRGERSFSTSIYYLLQGSDFSAFHRIKSDERLIDEFPEMKDEIVPFLR